VTAGRVTAGRIDPVGNRVVPAISPTINGRQARRLRVPSRRFRGGCVLEPCAGALSSTVTGVVCLSIADQDPPVFVRIHVG